MIFFKNYFIFVETGSFGSGGKSPELCCPRYLILYFFIEFITNSHSQNVFTCGANLTLHSCSVSRTCINCRGPSRGEGSCPGKGLVSALL